MALHAFALVCLMFAYLVLIEELRKHGIDVTFIKQKSNLFQNQVQRSKHFTNKMEESVGPVLGIR